MARSGYLLLEDGRQFDGECIGAARVALGEVVFNTSMTGYQEVLTDPSYAGQIITMTYPLIGNYGVNRADEESRKAQVAGFVIRELPPVYSNWRASGPLEAYLTANNVAGLAGVDTRALTRHIRSAGAMRAAIAPSEEPRERVLELVRAHPRMEGQDLTRDVATPEPFEWLPEGPERFRVVALDFGVKRNSLQLLGERGCRVVTVSGAAVPEEVLEQRPDGLFLSNGPGDPDAVDPALRIIRRLGDEGVPIFGICLGHQLLARAYGAHTYKLLYGHRGGNHPVRRFDTGAVEITAQNHGFAVGRGAGEDEVADAAALRVTHLNLNDQTIEGLEHRELPVFSVQYHPEAAPGPHDSLYLFERFIENMARTRQES